MLSKKLTNKWKKTRKGRIVYNEKPSVFSLSDLFRIAWKLQTVRVTVGTKEEQRNCFFLFQIVWILSSSLYNLQNTLSQYTLGKYARGGYDQLKRGKTAFRYTQNIGEILDSYMAGESLGQKILDSMPGMANTVGNLLKEIFK